MSKLSVDYVNRIKCEKWEEFEESIFSDVYSHACLLTREIIRRNKEYQEIDEADKFCNENQIFNVISFLGERGMGKSSAMLSFAYFLKSYSNFGKPVGEEYAFHSGKNIKFYVLSKIDAAMMVKGESLFDIVLAKMWDEFSSYEGRSPISQERVNSTKEKFRDVKAAYTEYWNVLRGEKKLNTASQLTELHELSQSLNLRKSFADLVISFLKCWKVNNEEIPYMVISIDDLDMVKDDIYNKLEQVRLFFTIPNVIVLVTADINRLSLDLSGMFSRQMICPSNVRESELKSVREYAGNYLAKVLPRNMRIYMPFFDGGNNQLQLEYKEYLQYIYQSNPIEKFSEGKFTLAVLAKEMDILMFPNAYIHSIKQKSLRNIVNSVSELVSIVRDNQDYSMLYQWIRKELSISRQGIETDKLAEFVQKLLHVQENMYNFCFVNWRFETCDQENDSIQNNPGYGSLLCKILDCQKKYFQDNEFTRLLIWICSVQISNALHEGKEIDSIFIKGDFFGSVLKDVNKNLEVTRNVSAIFSMKLLKGDSTEKTLVKNADTIYKRFKLLLLCDGLETVNKLEPAKTEMIKGEDSTELSNSLERTGSTVKSQNVIDMKVEEITSKVSIDNYFRNAVTFDELWTKYFHWLCMSVMGREDVKEDVEKNIRIKVEQKNGINQKIEDFHRWKERYSIKNLNDILPIQNVGVMAEIASRLQGLEKKQCESPQEYVKLVVYNVIDAYKTTEAYYHMDKMGEKKSISEALSVLYEIINFEEDEDDNFKLLIAEGYGVKDTSI